MKIQFSQINATSYDEKRKLFAVNYKKHSVK